MPEADWRPPLLLLLQVTLIPGDGVGRVRFSLLKRNQLFHQAYDQPKLTRAAGFSHLNLTGNHGLGQGNLRLLQRPRRV